MIARRRSPQGESYDTAVFALLYDRGNSLYVCFDEKGEGLIAAPLYERVCGGYMQTSLLIDPCTEGMVEKGRLIGYDWAIESDLIEMVKQGKRIPSEMFDRCHALQSKVFFPEKKQISTREDADLLLNTASGFHDGVIKEITKEGELTRIVLSVWGGRIVFLAEDAVLSPYCKEGFGALGQIFSADFFFRAQGIYFGGDQMCREPDAPTPKGYFFSAKKLWYIPEAY